MDYPDPDEEYELMHADEFELMNELDDDDSSIPLPKQPKKSSQKRLDFSGSSKPSKPSTTEDEYPQDEDLMPFQGSSISNVGQLNDPPPSLNASGIIDEVAATNNKRNAADLFGDISDLEIEFSLPKRQKLEDEASKEERQLKLIETIVERRRKLNEDKLSFMQSISGNDSKREGCISAGLMPKWPFMPVSVRGERVYARLHEEHAKLNVLQGVNSRPNGAGLLDIPYSELYKMAMSEMTKKIDNQANKKVESMNPHCADLWVEKYKPKVYLELLSDEATNRTLLHWLRLWDKVVFNKEPKVLKRGFHGQEKPNLLDEHHRPLQKVALLCGPPGLGKTTLAHMICKQAGYSPVEVNASDDRTAQSFKLNLDSATQMKSVAGANAQPNCLILDEIDGAPQPAIDVLVKYITDKGDAKGKKKKGLGILRRPIICICNDIYVPSLRPLRQIAHTIVFPPTSSTRLGERLVEISKFENIMTDLATMMALSEKSNNDIRSCLSVLQYLKAKSPRVTLSQIQSSTVGEKDMQYGLFSVWETVFHIKLDKKRQSSLVEKTKVGNGSSHLNSSWYGVLKTVQSYGDYDRLTVGVFENYAKVRTTESSFAPIVKAMDYFIFNDLLSTFIQSSQNYAVLGYLPWAFVLWHLLFASIQRPRLSYPSLYYEANTRIQRNQQILRVAFSGMAPKLQSYQHRETLLMDVAPMLVELITPVVRPVSFQLYSQKEKDEVQRVVGVMADYNLGYIQFRTPEGSYTFSLDPNLEELVSFGDRPRENITTYTVKQMLSKEVESEKIRRASMNSQLPPNAKSTNEARAPLQPKPVDKPKPSKEPSVPNHLQKLTPKALKKKTEEGQMKDFFGRVVSQPVSSLKGNAKTDEIVKSDIWFHFKEGYNNAVRKNVYISDLL